MLQLIKTDFCLFKRYFLLIAVYMLGFPLLLRNSWDSTASMMMVLSVYIFIFSVLGIEERDKIELLQRTLPIKASVIVGAKYVESMLVWGFAAILFALVSCFLSFSSEISSNLSQQVQIIALSLSVTLIFVSFSLPICYKLGFAKSRVAMIFVWIFAACSFPMIAMIAKMELLGLLIGILIASIIITFLSWKLSTRIYKNKIV